jgi:hypothetical protein
MGSKEISAVITHKSATGRAQSRFSAKRPKILTSVGQCGQTAD